MSAVLVEKNVGIDYHFIFDNADDALILWAHDLGTSKYTVLDVNKTACQRYGYSREEFIGMDGTLLNTTQSLIQSKTGLHKLDQERHSIGELTHITKDGRLIPIETHAHQFLMNGKSVTLSVCRDITERKRREKETLDLLVNSLVGAPISELLSKLETASLLKQNEFGEFTFSPSLTRVFFRGKNYFLTPTESTLLRALVLRAGKVITYNELARMLGKQSGEDFIKKIRVYVYQLRQKLEKDPENPKIIITKPSKGYYIATLP